MKAIRTEGTNLELTLAGAGEDRTLPAQIIQAYDPDLGQTEADAHEAIESQWSPTDGERKALVNGADVHLIIHVPRDQHPPVSLEVGNPIPDISVALLSKDHVDRAVGFWFAAIAERLNKSGFPTDPQEVLELWHKALEETREGAMPVDLGERLERVAAEVEAEGDDPKDAAA